MGKSLAAQKGIVAPPPDVFGSGELINAEDSFERVPYATFLSPKSTELWAKAGAAGVALEDGCQVLFFPEPEAPIRLVPMQFMLLAATQYWAETKDRQLVRVSMRKDIGLKEQIDAALLIILNDKIVPARCTFRTTKCPACLTAVKELKAARETETWAKKSEEHQIVAAHVDNPSYRFTATVRTSGRTAASGFAYKLAESTCKPSTPAELKLLQKLFESEDGMKDFKAVGESYQRRINTVKAKAAAK